MIVNMFEKIDFSWIDIFVCKSAIVDFLVFLFNLKGNSLSIYIIIIEAGKARSVFWENPPSKKGGDVKWKGNMEYLTILVVIMFLLRESPKRKKT